MCKNVPFLMIFKVLLHNFFPARGLAMGEMARTLRFSFVYVGVAPHLRRRHTKRKEGRKEGRNTEGAQKEELGFKGGFRVSFLCLSVCLSVCDSKYYI